GTPGINNQGTRAANPPGRGGACFDSPYGFTTVHADSQLVSYYKQLNVCWVRYQFHWAKGSGQKPGIESAPGKYDWSQLDPAITTLNAAGIHIDFAIQDAPDWERSQICAATGQHFLPGPTEMKNFAQLIASRYNGNNGHGYIDAFEIGNEEFDNYYVKNTPSSESCRSANYYGDVLKAGYQAIKAANPKALVGMFGMWWHNLPHIKDYMTYLFSHGYGQYMDYMNFHYYHSGEDPSVTDGDNPSFDLQWQTMHSVAAQYGFGTKPIWVTETGWSTDANPNAKAGVSDHAVSVTTQANYMQYILNESAKSGVVTKVFWFTINSPNEAHNIYLPNGSPLPAVQVLTSMIRQKVAWR
ncbi:MAG: hypothetical protein M3Z24_06495, partial [Chloroflexota bacterium]|nr:hypothetical protein [Chloroflexota bacterium]